MTAITWRRRLAVRLLHATELGIWTAFWICALVSVFTTAWVMAGWLATALGARFDIGWNRRENGRSTDV